MFGNTISMMEKSMDYLWKKQEVTANNIANVDTPGYRRKRVNFEETFRRKLEATALTGKNEDVRQAIQSSKSYVVEDAHTQSSICFVVLSSCFSFEIVHFRTVLYVFAMFLSDCIVILLSAICYTLKSTNNLKYYTINEQI